MPFEPDKQTDRQVIQRIDVHQPEESPQNKSDLYIK